MALIKIANALSSRNIIYKIIIHNNELYGSAGTDGALYKWNGVDAWEQVCNPTGKIVYDIISFDNKIWGVRETDTTIQFLYWAGGTDWVVAHSINDSTYLLRSLVIHNNILYGTNGMKGLADDRYYLYHWTGSDLVRDVGFVLGTSFTSMISFDGSLYGLLSDGTLLKWNGTSFDTVASGVGIDGYGGLCIHNNLLYCAAGSGSAPKGKIYLFNGSAWILQASVELSAFSEMMYEPLSYNDKILICCKTSVLNHGYISGWTVGDLNITVDSLQADSNSLWTSVIFNNEYYCASQLDGCLYMRESVIPPTPPTPLTQSDIQIGSQIITTIGGNGIYRRVKNISDSGHVYK